MNVRPRPICYACAKIYVLKLLMYILGLVLELLGIFHIFQCCIYVNSKNKIEWKSYTLFGIQRYFIIVMRNELNWILHSLSLYGVESLARSLDVSDTLDANLGFTFLNALTYRQYYELWIISSSTLDTWA